MTHSIDIWVNDEKETEKLAGILASVFKQGGVIYLNGELGVGKTALARHILKALGVKGAIKSPTYTLIEQYKVKSLTIYHCDLYRLTDIEELTYLNFNEIATIKTLTLIEWSKKMESQLPKSDIEIDIGYSASEQKMRKIKLDFRQVKVYQKALGMWQDEQRK